MKIVFILSIIILSILFIGKKFFSLVQRNLFKDYAAWSGKDIKIKRNKSKETSEQKRDDNYLNIIADESRIYLEAESKKEEG